MRFFFIWTRGLYVCLFCLLITLPPLTKASTNEFIMQCSFMHYIWSSNTKYVSLLIRKSNYEVLASLSPLVIICFQHDHEQQALYNCVFPCSSFENLTPLHQSPVWCWHVVERKMMTHYCCIVSLLKRADISLLEETLTCFSFLMSLLWAQDSSKACDIL